MPARIYRPARTAMQSGRAKTKSWVLELEQERPRRIEPLMGWTASADMRQQVRLSFASKEEALLTPGGADQPRLSGRLRAQPAELPVQEAIRAAVHQDVVALEADPADLLDRMTVLMSTPSLLPRLVEISATDEREFAVAIAERTGQDAGTALLPALLAAVVSAALRVSLLRWQAQGGTTPLTALADEALDAVAAGLPAAR